MSVCVSVLCSGQSLLCYVFGGLVQLGVEFFMSIVYTLKSFWILVMNSSPCGYMLRLQASSKGFLSRASLCCCFGVSKSMVATALVLLPSFCSFVASFLTLGLATLFVCCFEGEVGVAWLQFPDLHSEVADADEGCGCY